MTNYFHGHEMRGMVCLCHGLTARRIAGMYYSTNTPEENIEVKKKPSKKKVPKKEEPTLSTDVQRLGLAFMRLGEAMQNPDVKIGNLANLAADCGLVLRFGFKKQEPTV